MVDGQEQFGYLEVLSESTFERFNMNRKQEYRTTYQRRFVDMVETDRVTDTRRIEILRRTNDLCNVKLSMEAEKRIHMEQTGCSPVRDAEKTTHMFLQIAPDEVPIVGGDVAFVYP